QHVMDINKNTGWDDVNNNIYIKYFSRYFYHFIRKAKDALYSKVSTITNATIQAIYYMYGAGIKHTEAQVLNKDTKLKKTDKKIKKDEKGIGEELKFRISYPESETP